MGSWFSQRDGLKRDFQPQPSKVSSSYLVWGCSLEQRNTSGRTSKRKVHLHVH